MERLVSQSGNYVLPPRLDLRQELQRSRQEGSATSTKLSSKKGEPWTEEEHVAFLHGLQNLGKGQWKQISRLYVPTRTPTQVASHAQKHFLRVSGSTKRRSRFSAVEEANAAPAPGTSLAIPSLPTHLPLGPPLEVLGRPTTGVTLGVPVSHPAWLPPPVKQVSATLPIYPVGPSQHGGIHATHQGDTSPSSSRDSRPLSGPPSPDALGHHMQQQQARQQEAQQQHAGSLPRATSPQPPRQLPAPTPGSRQQQLLRLLDMREQLQLGTGAATGLGAFPPLPEFHAPHPHPLLLQAPPAATPLLPVGASLLHPRPHPRPGPASSAGSGSAATSQQGRRGPSASSAGTPACRGAVPAGTAVPAELELQQGNPVKIEPGSGDDGELQQPRRSKLRKLGAAQGPEPGGLAMLAAAAAYSDTCGSGGGAKRAEADSDADTTLGHAHEAHTV